MGLSDRSSGERLPLELGEHRIDVVAELGPEDGGDALTRLGRDPVLQCRQFGADVDRQQIDSRRSDLTELDVDPARLLEHAPQPHAMVVELRRTARSPRTEPLAPGDADELPIPAEHGTRRRMARTGRGMTTRPARSPIASEPGRASRSNATAAAIVAKMPMATRCSTRPSAPQSQRLTPSATAIAIPQPTTPASRAVPQPRRIPRSRSDTLVMTTASTIPTTHAEADTEDGRHHDRAQPSPPTHVGAPAPHEREPRLALDLVDELGAGLEREGGVEGNR